jgi:16S rRNA (cytidine1402-2'-O)-methyltransferase
MKETIPGTLIVAAAPIGCAGDASARLAAALAGASVIAAEDTRRIRRLAADLDVRLTAQVVSCYEAVEQRRAESLLADLKAGSDVLLVTDAGMPGISDPGYRLVKAATAAGIRVTALPGPSAVTAALAVAGLPSDRFCFEGFPPRRTGDRARRFAELATEPRTLVFFESPRRLGVTLGELAEAFGPGRPAVVCRELTKTHEEIRRGTLSELADWAAGGVRGEVTFVIAGNAGEHRRGEDVGRAAADVAGRQAGGLTTKEAIAAVAADLGLPKRTVYDAVIANRLRGRPT